MDDDLNRLEAKVEENHRLLKKLLLHNRWLSLVTAIKWIVVIGAAFGLYYYLQPFIDQTVQLYKTILDGFPGL